MGWTIEEVMKHRHVDLNIEKNRLVDTQTPEFERHKD